jgi:hypothetical protein
VSIVTAGEPTTPLPDAAGEFELGSVGVMRTGRNRYDQETRRRRGGEAVAGHSLFRLDVIVARTVLPQNGPETIGGLSAGLS